MKKILPPIIISIVLICAVVVLLVLRGTTSDSKKAADNGAGPVETSELEGDDTGMAEADDADTMDAEPEVIEFGEEFTIILEENQAAGGF